MCEVVPNGGTSPEVIEFTLYEDLVLISSAHPMITGQVGVILMTYGLPATLDDIPTHLKNIRGGRPTDETLIAEFRRCYRLIEGSGLTTATHPSRASDSVASGFELAASWWSGFHVVAGMHFGAPLIADVAPEIKAFIHQVISVILSPQYSPIIMSGYARTLEDAVTALLGDDRELRIARDWHLEPLFLQALAAVVQQTME